MRNVGLILMFWMLNASMLTAQTDCFIESVQLWTDRDYMLSGESIQGELFITGSLTAASTVQLAMIGSSNNSKDLAIKTVNLDQQKGSFEWSTKTTDPSGWRWLLVLHPTTSTVLAAKKIYLLNTEQSVKKPAEPEWSIWPEGGHWVKNQSQHFLIRTGQEATEAFVMIDGLPNDTLTLINGIASGELFLADSIDVTVKVNYADKSTFKRIIPDNLPSLKVFEEGPNLKIEIIGSEKETLQLVILSQSDSISYTLSDHSLLLPIRYLPKGLKHFKLLDNGQPISERWYHLVTEEKFEIIPQFPSTGSTDSTLEVQVKVTNAVGQPLDYHLIQHGYYPYFQLSDNGISASLQLLNEHWRRVAIVTATDSNTINDLLIGASFLSDNLLKPSNECLPNGVKITGRLSQKPSMGTTMILSIPGAMPGLYYTTTYSQFFEFPGIPENLMSTGFIYSNSSQDDLSFQLEQPVVKALERAVDELPDPLILNHLKELKIIADNYELDEPEADLNQIKSKFKTIYRQPDYHIPLDEYVYLENMTTVIKEIVPYVFFKKKKIMVFSEEQRKTFPGEPLILLNGIPVANDSVILKLEPAAIDYIDVLNSRNSLLPLGYLAINGVVAVYTKEQNEIPSGNQKINLPITAKPGQSYQKTANSNSLSLSAVSVWQSHKQIDSTVNSLVFPTLTLGSTYTMGIGVFHPSLGLQKVSQSLILKYKDAP